MPIFDIECPDCGYRGEVIHLSGDKTPACPSCGQANTIKRLSPTSTLTGKTAMRLPGPSDTGCCGSAPGHAGCAGPGTCCGKTPH